MKNKSFFLTRAIASIILLTSWSLSFNVYAGENEDVWNTLQKAALAARSLSYEGIFVYQAGAQVKSVQITHIFDGKNEYSRNLVLDGSPREVLSQGGDLVIYNPHNEKIIIEKRRGQNMFPAVLPVNLDSIKDNYGLRMGPLERVAGRPAKILYLEPKDGLRYSYKFWIDTEYGLLLKSVMYNKRSDVLESISFNQISLLNTVELDWFKPKIDHNKKYEMEDEQIVVADSNVHDNWEVKGLPAGYRKVEQVVRRVHGKPYPVTHVVFSDGLASVSLFIESAPKTVKTPEIKLKHKPKAMLTTAGSTSFYACMNSDHLVTVVGEVPEATVVQIGNAIIFKKYENSK